MLAVACPKETSRNRRGDRSTWHRGYCIKQWESKKCRSDSPKLQNRSKPRKFVSTEIEAEVETVETDTEATEDDPYSNVFILRHYHVFRDISWSPELGILSVLSVLSGMTIVLCWLWSWQLPMSILWLFSTKDANTCDLQNLLFPLNHPYIVYITIPIYIIHRQDVANLNKLYERISTAMYKRKCMYTVYT